MKRAATSLAMRYTWLSLGWILFLITCSHARANQALSPFSSGMPHSTSSGSSEPRPEWWRRLMMIRETVSTTRPVFVAKAFDRTRGIKKDANRSPPTDRDPDCIEAANLPTSGRIATTSCRSSRRSSRNGRNGDINSRCPTSSFGDELDEESCLLWSPDNSPAIPAQKRRILAWVKQEDHETTPPCAVDTPKQSFLTQPISRPWPFRAGLASSSTNLPSRSSRSTTQLVAAKPADGTTASFQDGGRPRMWPPWPFNLVVDSLQDRRKRPGDGASSQTKDSPDSTTLGAASTTTTYHSGAYYFWFFVQETARSTASSVRRATGQLWMHLPPAAPPLLLLACLPRRPAAAALEAAQAAAAAAGSTALSKNVVIPLFSNPVVRTWALSGVGLAVLSWAHANLHRKRGHTPLPLAYPDIHRAILPPFLPEQLPAMNYLAAPDEDDDEDDDDNDESDVNADTQHLHTTNPAGGLDSTSSSAAVAARPLEHDLQLLTDRLPPRLRNHVHQFMERAPRPQSIWKEWKRMRKAKFRNRQHAKRKAVMEQLMALQELKHRATLQKKKLNGSSWSTSWYYPSSLAYSRFGHRHQANGKKNDTSLADDASTLGYALVTGASRGIGRALAVELARWEIPLILVARDVDRLTSLAYDLEACYGIPCCVLSADLSKPGSAEQVYHTVKLAGLKVDFLINNAGFSSHGLLVDLPLQEAQHMLQLNAVSATTLVHLFGRDMKERRRGRILMVSSICGSVAGIATVALYSATKAFENVLAVSLSKELEPYGVGVTCLMPGAVRDTDFRTKSRSHQALCWKFPFYARQPQEVAAMGIRAMLRGETEATLGWQNRLFLRVLKPVLPQRIHNLMAEIMWNPLRLPFQRRHDLPQVAIESPEPIFIKEVDKTTPTTPLNTSPGFDLQPRYKYQPPPRLLLLPPDVIQEKPTSSSTSQSTVQDDPDSPAQSEMEGAPAAAPPKDADTLAPTDKDSIDDAHSEAIVQS